MSGTPLGWRSENPSESRFVTDRASSPGNCRFLGSEIRWFQHAQNPHSDNPVSQALSDLEATICRGGSVWPMFEMSESKA